LLKKQPLPVQKLYRSRNAGYPAPPAQIRT
jgi:hypothetical protein